jgi:hypothetical protein
MSQMVGAGAQVTRGGPEAASGREAVAGAAGARGGPGANLSREPKPRGHVTALKLPPAERREPLS